MLLLVDKDDGVWEVMSSVSSTSHKGYKRVMTKLLKKSSQLVTVAGGRVSQQGGVRCHSGWLFSCGVC